MKRRIVGTIGLIMILTLSVLVVSNHSPKSAVEDFEQPVKPAKFIIASWDYPDEYGQGIDAIKIWENSTGSWLGISEYPSYYWYYDTGSIEWYTNASMRLRCWSWFNSTLTGAGSLEEGKNLFRHNVTVLDNSGTTVFSQQNFTFYGEDDSTNPPMWYYGYEVVLNFIPEEFQVYTVAITYEVFFETIEYGESYLHDCSNTDGISYDSNAGLAGGDYGIGSDGTAVEIWITPDSVVDEYVEYKIDFINNIDNTNGGANLTTRYKVEDGFTSFRLTLYYNDSSWDSTGPLTSQSWVNVSLTPDNKVLDYILVRCDDNPNTVTSGNRSIYADFVEITNQTGSLAFLVDQWNEVTTIALYLDVQMSIETEWGLDSTLIILGLVMVPTSTIYLAYGAKHDRSSDRLFYGLIIFFLGCGLFIGGVMP